MASAFVSFSIFATLLSQAAAQTSCSNSLTPKAVPSVAPGYHANVIANGFTRPRSIIFDKSGNLLVVEGGIGVTALKLKDDGGSCLSVQSKSTVIANTSLNHGIQLSADGKTLYASSSSSAWRWSYDSGSAKTTSDATQLVSNMDNSDHITRTLLLSSKSPDQLLISRGSSENYDPIAADVKSGHSQIRAFDISDTSRFPYDYPTGGTMIGWGLRNSVGVAEHPVTGGIYSVENSVDDVERNGVDFHTNNPGEEMNFHGYLNGTKHPNQGANFGYPNCFAAWKPQEVPDSGTLTVGGTFSINSISTQSDTDCRSNSTGPRLTFPAHWAPLDIKFNTRGSLAYVTSHGSWNRQPPTGYQLVAVPFSASTGDPIARADSDTSYSTIVANPDVTKCPNSCFRPVGLAFDPKGRLFMTSDTTGEIYVITATDGGSVDSYQEVGNASSTDSGTGGTGGTTGSGGKTGNASQSFGNGGHGRIAAALLMAVMFAVALS